MLQKPYLNAVYVICILLITLATLPRLVGQGATATIQGIVTDTSGAAIPAAAIQVKSAGTGAASNSQSDPQGRFNIADLPVGTYTVSASKTGFSTVVHEGVVLNVGAQAVVDFALAVGQQTQTITVQGEVSQVETTNATVGALVDQTQMKDLPLNGRNFEQLILLAPGVQQINAFSSSGFQGRAPEYSIAGARPTGQALLLDDENMQNFWNKGMGSITGSSLGVEAIGEFQTMTNTFSAQFGGNGGVVNAVSKSGSNSFHGSAYEFLRNDVLDSFNTFAKRGIDPAKPALRQNQYGGTAGGPVKRDKAFFFVNYEGIQRALGETQVALVPACNVPGVCTVTATDPVTAQAVANLLKLWPLPDPGTINGNVGKSTQNALQTAHENYVLGRFDLNISDKDSLFVRYVSDKADYLEPFAGGGQTGQLPLWPEQDYSHAQFLTAEWKRIITPSVVNVARASFSRPGTSALTTDSFPALQLFPGAGRQDATVSTSNVFSGIGGNVFLPFTLIQNRLTESDDILWTSGAHSIRMGISVSRLQTNTNDPFRAGGMVTFQDLPHLLAGQISTLLWVPLNPTPYQNRDWRNTEITPYIQDDWKLTRRLTVNLGLRWEFYTDPYDVHNQIYNVTNFTDGSGYVNVSHEFKDNPTWKNFEPRVGFAYDLFADHKTSLRGGFGIFHELIMPATYFPGAVASPPWTTLTSSVATTGQFVNYPSIPSSATPTYSQSSQADYNTQKTPYMIQYNLNLQRELFQGTLLSVGYVGSRGVDLVSPMDFNPPVPTIDANGVYHFGTLQANGTVLSNPRVSPNRQLLSFGSLTPQFDSRYNSLQTSLNRRLSKNFQVQAAYTLSNSIDNGGYLSSYNSNVAGALENPFQRSVDNSPSSFDVRHVLRVNGLAMLPFHGNVFVEGWQLSGIVSATSGTPVTLLDGFDMAGSGTSPRPNYVAGCNPYSGTYNGQQVGGPNLWYNPSCYSLEAPGTLGNLGRDTIRGPHFVDTDLALLKDTRIRRLSETFDVQFRAEFFNIFNHANYALPANTLFSNSAGGRLPTAGFISSIVGTPRQIQFAVKLVF